MLKITWNFISGNIIFLDKFKTFNIFFYLKCWNYYNILLLFTLQLIRFKNEHEDSLSLATRAVNQAIERTHNNINWMNSNYVTILNWLHDNGYGNNGPWNQLMILLYRVSNIISELKISFLKNIYIAVEQSI